MKRKERDTVRGHVTRRAEHEPATGERVDLTAGFRIAVIAGVDAGAAIDAKRPSALVGSHSSCDLVVSDGQVSRFHVELAVAGDRIAVRDLDSTNGTRVDGVAIGFAYAGPGSVITIGETRLQIGAASEPVRVATSTRATFGTLVGGSPAMQQVFAVLERASASDATVLVEGETGTGKEAVAESIHRESAREKGPFVVVDCGAIPSELLESELFGHEKGAFTGAVVAREGAFEAATGGTLFLDEIGELSLELQPKLLRAIERHEIKRVGRTKYMPVDVRVIAATHRDLRAMVNAQRFRSDLYYRLAVIDVRLPPLRGRSEDLPRLVDRLLDKLGAQPATRAALTSKASLDELAHHSWPGNVRELRNWLERSVALDERAALPTATAEDPTVDLDRPLRGAREAWLRPFERRYLEGLMKREAGNITAAARAAGVDRITFYRLLSRHRLR